jgi:hypothetical protein
LDHRYGETAPEALALIGGEQVEGEGTGDGSSPARGEEMKRWMED